MNSWLSTWGKPVVFYFRIQASSLTFAAIFKPNMYGKSR